MGVAVLESLLKHEQHGHHHQGHVAMPGGPLSGLILRHADMTLRVLKGSFDPESLRLHLRQLSDTGLSGSVTQAVLERARGVQFPPYNQMPTVSVMAVFVPQPYSLVQHLNDQVSLGCMPQGLPAPQRCGLFLHPLAHLDRLRIALIVYAWAAQMLWRQIRNWISRIDVLIRVNVRDKRFSLPLHRLQQFQGVPVCTVHADPLEAHTACARMSYDLLRQLKLGAMNLLHSRNSRAFAPTRILSPFLRQVQPGIDQTDSITSAQRTKHSNLAVVLFPQAAIPLTRHPDRLIALLGEGALIKIQPRAALSPEQSVRVARHPIHDWAIIPRGVRQKILQHLVVAVRDCFDHALHVALLRLHQAAQILLGRLDHAVVARAERIRDAVAESPESATQLFERFAMSYPVFRFAFR